MSIREYMRHNEEVVFATDLAKKNLVTENRTSQSNQVRPIAPVTIYDRIRVMQRSIENEKWLVGDKINEVESIKAQTESLSKRFQLKRKRELIRTSEELQVEIEEITSGRKEKAFTESAKPYVREYQKQQFCRPRTSSEGLSHNSSKESKVLEDYIVQIEGAAPKFEINATDVCETCEVNMQLYTTLSLLVCPRCGITRTFLDATASLLAYSDDSYDYCSFSYKRINHFSEWLASIQAKENLDIPIETLQLIMQRLQDERVSDVEDITVHKVREILKKLKMRKYYEHVQLITCKITGRQPPRMTPEMEERIKVCFLAASSSFQRHCPPDRKNMISYQLVLLKLCELLGYTEFVPYFMLLKGKDKLTKMDDLWRKICADLDWQFVPSLP